MGIAKARLYMKLIGGKPYPCETCKNHDLPNRKCLVGDPRVSCEEWENARKHNAKHIKAEQVRTYFSYLEE